MTHEGRFDRVTGAGLWPLPLQRPIPIWLGGSSVPAYRTGGPVGRWLVPPDGPWLQRWTRPSPSWRRRPPAPAAIRPLLGMEGRLAFDGRDADALVRTGQQWQDAAATHLAVNTLEQGLPGLDAHLDALAVAADALQVREKSS